VGDGDDHLLGSGEELVERSGEALGHVRSALAPSRARHVGLVRPGPRSVVDKRPTLVRPEPNLVEARQHKARHVPITERKLERLLRPSEPRAHTEADWFVRERLPQAERLLDAKLGEAFSRRRRADAIVGIRTCVRVPDEQQTFQKSTLR
jgi:hypothetical protein